LVLRMDSVAQRTTQHIDVEVNELLQISFVDFFEKMASRSMSLQESKYQEEEREEQLLARGELKQSELDMKLAMREEQRAQELLRNTTVDAAMSENATQQALLDSTLLQSILSNFSLDLHDAMEVQQRLQTLNAKCIRGFHWICNTLGHAVQLRKRAQVDSVRAHDELAQAEIVRHRERRETVYAQVLRGETVDCNRTAMKVLQAAEQYETLARAAREAAERENRTGMLDERRIHLIQDNEKRLEDLEAANDRRMHEIDAHIKSERQRLAIRAVLTIGIATMALFFFSLQGTLHSWFLVRSISMSQQPWTVRREILGVFLVHVSSMLWELPGQIDSRKWFESVAATL
jgi:hypothetical protein